MKTIINPIILLVSVLFFSAECQQKPPVVTIFQDELLDRIMGGWAGQTIGCTFGGPTEFRYNGRMIPDSVVIPWTEHYVMHWYETFPGLYDDLYVELTFVDMYDQHGLDVSIDVLANAFANAGYTLWAANQTARYNILNGIRPPASGHWKNNPHADDIDFQIEADFAGLMSPGMPVSAAEICDGVGHIMNHGDGWYGGVYVATMYSLAFISDDMEYVVKEALKSIPEQSRYYQCINDVIGWWEQNEDWKVTWQLVSDKWTNEIFNPYGTNNPYTIDAKLNSAWVVLGLLYGNKDFERTLEITTRCGDDSDCNPATAAGILGTMLGYSNIDAKWIDNLKEVEDIPFSYTDISLNKAYRLSFEQALEMIKRGGGEVSDNEVNIVVQKSKTVRFEQNFPGFELIQKELHHGRSMREPFSFEFNGIGFVCSGQVRPRRGDYVAEIEVDINGNKEIVKMPANYTIRKEQIYWNYELEKGNHQVSLRWLNPIPETDVIIHSVLTYTKNH